MKIKSVLLLSFCLVLTASLANAEVVYREIFSANGTNEPLLANSGWDSRWTTNATALQYNVQTKADGGPTPNLPPINSNPVWGTNIGRTYLRTTAYPPADQPFILWTSEYNPVLSSIEKLTEARFWERHSTAVGNTLTHDTFHFVLQIGGTWYVSDQSTALTGANSTSASDGTWYEQSIGLSNATWRTLSFTPNSTLSQPGSSVSLPVSGTVTSFGFYVPAVSTTLHDYRFDSIELYMIPEPSSALLLVLGGLFLWCRRSIAK